MECVHLLFIHSHSAVFFIIFHFLFRRNADNFVLCCFYLDPVFVWLAMPLDVTTTKNLITNKLCFNFTRACGLVSLTKQEGECTLLYIYVPALTIDAKEKMEEDVQNNSASHIGN